MTLEGGKDPVQRLVDEFHTLLDEALIVAIASDYSLHEATGFKAARSTLQDLAQNVPSEEASGFNPSGIPVGDEGSDAAKGESLSSGSDSRPSSQTNVTAPSSADASSSSAGESRHDFPRLSSFDGDTDESKIILLQSMFAELSDYDIKHALKKANGDFQISLDDLLNVQYLKSTGQDVKGIDAFFQPEDLSSQKAKRKRRKNKHVNRASPPGLGILSDDTIGDGDDAQLEIDYIAARFGIRSDEVSEVYNKNQRSAGAAVEDLLNQYLSHGIETKDEAGRQHADALAKKYRHVPSKLMPTIVHVAGSIPQFADDLATLLNKHFSKMAKGQKLDLAYRLTPLPKDEIEGMEQLAIGSARQATAAGSATLPLLQTGPADLDQALWRSDQLHQVKRDSLVTAAQLHRRGGSSPLYRQAAVFYTDRAREHGRHAQLATSAAADILVQQQSTSRSIDLHGVLVHDGVRIALQKTQEWWAGLGEFRVRKAREEGFTVITGLGRHSAGGVSPLRRAVAAALLQDGWKLQVETGKFIVTGRR